MRTKLALISALLAFSSAACAHFGMILPDNAIVTDQKDSTITLTAAFLHPMEQNGMNMAKPKNISVFVNGKKADITDKFNPTKVLDKDAWVAQYKIDRPGLYQFVVDPQPYWEPAEDKFIVHYTKVAVSAFGDEGEWNEPLGLKTEIVPLTRPFGNYAGNVFRGKVLVDGEPVAGLPVEVEYYNVEGKVTPPNEVFVTQVVMTDDQGVFSYAVPWAGWWGFAALTESDAKLKKDGQDKDVEVGAVLWSEFVKPPL